MEGQDSAAQDPASRLAALRTEHRDLDFAIDALRTMAASDDIQVLEDQAIPDIIA